MQQMRQAQVVGVTGPISQAITQAIDKGEKPPAQALRLLEAAFEQSGAAILITDGLDRIVMMNPAFMELSGHPLDTMLGQNAELMGMAPLRGTHLPELEQVLREGRRWSGESSLTTAQGDQLALWLNVSVVRDERQRVTHHCRVFQDVNPLKEQLRAMADQARHDSLTGLPNRRAFGEHLFKAMARTRRYPKTLAIMCVDLDGFKGVNDRHGHHVGDELLIQVARRLQACMRTTDIVCRMGGDEFMLILEGAGTTQDVQRMGTRVLTCLSEAYAIEGHHITVTPSIGAVMHDGQEPDTRLIERADASMYAAKNGGKGRLVMSIPQQDPPQDAKAVA
jgi:diguanylate cyclase (GGDEF)-like protein/PAS domain S-box-containing protein